MACRCRPLPPSIYWKLEVGLIKAVCCRCRHGSKTPALPSARMQSYPTRKAGDPRLHFDHAKVGQNRSCHFKLRTSDFGLSVPPSRSRRLAMDREPRHTHTHSKRLVWRGARTHTYSDSNFQKRIRRLIGSTAGEWEIDECFGSGDQRGGPRATRLPAHN